MNLVETNPFDLSERTNNSPLILDGALGSYLQQKGFQPDESLWFSHMNILNPEKVIEIHNEYIAAGADIITANTFRTNPVSSKDSNYTSEILVKSALKNARDSVGKLPTLIAGSNAPAEDCYKRHRLTSDNELKMNHHKHISLLMDNGSHLILNETHSHFDEIKIICEYCSKNNIPFVVSLFLDETGNLLSGHSVDEIIKLIEGHAPLAISVNCIKPALFQRIYPIFSNKFNWGFYFNCGKGEYLDAHISIGINARKYAKIAEGYLENNPSFIGACCGSTPSHIKELKKMIDGFIRN